MKEIRHPHHGIVGYMHEVACKDPQSMIVIQLPRLTRTLSPETAKAAMECIDKVPGNKNILLIGCDVNLYELTGADLSALKLRSII